MKHQVPNGLQASSYGAREVLGIREGIIEDCQVNWCKKVNPQD